MDGSPSGNSRERGLCRKPAACIIEHALIILGFFLRSELDFAGQDDWVLVGEIGDITQDLLRLWATRSILELLDVSELEGGLDGVRSVIRELDDLMNANISGCGTTRT